MSHFLTVFDYAVLIELFLNAYLKPWCFVIVLSYNKLVVQDIPNKMHIPVLDKSITAYCKDIKACSIFVMQPCVLFLPGYCQCTRHVLVP